MIREVNIYVARRASWKQTAAEEAEEERQVASVLVGIDDDNVPVHVYDNDGVYLYTPQGEEGQSEPKKHVRAGRGACSVCGADWNDDNPCPGP